MGPKINGNPEKVLVHTLIKHEEAETFSFRKGPRTLEQIRELVIMLALDNGWEGIVFHHPDGRMAKIKFRDFEKDYR